MPIEYSLHLMEKQKSKYTYVVLERQFRKMFEIAASKKGITGENLLQLLESRLDNTVFRMGIAKSRRQARQLVSHKHITVNGNIVNIPSYTMKSGDVVAIKNKSQVLTILESNLTNMSNYSWIEWDKSSYSGKYLNDPERSEIPENIKEQLIVELYSK